ncbi:hypothetical protein LZ30DRAFT_714937 [Colletotrichum cereale]|nr:hypothetical protein LZ30DRAFT_714937 [Colletotrichum cereale]
MGPDVGMASLGAASRNAPWRERALATKAISIRARTCDSVQGRTGSCAVGPLSFPLRRSSPYLDRIDRPDKPMASRTHAHTHPCVIALSDAEPLAGMQSVRLNPLGVIALSPNQASRRTGRCLTRTSADSAMLSSSASVWGMLGHHQRNAVFRKV